MSSVVQTQVDVLVVNYGNADETLAAVAPLATRSDVQIFVVDNSVDAGQAERLRAGVAGHQRVQLTVADSNLGFGRACNLGFAAGRAPWVLLLNPDANLGEAGLCQLTATLQARPVLAAVAPRIDWTPDGSFVLPLAQPQGPAARAWTAVRGRLSAWGLDLETRWADRRARRCSALMVRGRPFDAECLSGAVMLLRRDAVIRAGGLFDPRFFMFFEDTDLCLRLRRAGYRLAIDPLARARHAWRNGAHKAPLMATAEQQFLHKHHPWLQRWWPRWVRWGALHTAWQRRGPELGAFEHAEAFNEAAPEGVRALSPSPWMDPAAVRPRQVAAPLRSHEWALLEPGRYMAQLGSARGTAGWVPFIVLPAAA